MYFQEELFRINLEGGYLFVRTNGDETPAEIRVELSQRLSGNWHYITVRRTATNIHVFVDDVSVQEAATSDVADLLVGLFINLI